MSSLKLNHSRDYHNFLENVIESELEQDNKITSESLWVKMGDQLEMEGVPKHEISIIMRKDIEDGLFEKEFKEHMLREDYKWHSGHYFRVVKKHDWVIPYQTENNTNNPLGDSNNSSINTPNSNMLLQCDNLIDICRTIKEKAKDCESLEKIFGEKEMSEFYKQQNTMIDNIKNAIDNKTKIPENTETFLLECLATVMGNTNKCGQIFQEVILMHMKEQGKFLTQKQATKFQTGGKQSQFYLLKPTDRDFAIYAGYTGSRCTGCQGFRVRPKADHSKKWECYDCGEIMPSQHIPKCNHCQIPLYTERLKQVASTGKCPGCTETLEIPQTLIDQANS